MNDEYNPLMPAFEAMRKDAERYRWLRDKAVQLDQTGAFTPYVVRGQTMTVLDGDTLDAAVDSAIKGPNA